MYQITKDHKLQVTRRVYDETQEIVVFHVYIVNENTRSEGTEYVELRNGVSKGLRIPESYVPGRSSDDKLVEGYDTENLTYYDSAMTTLGTGAEPSDTAAEEYLVTVGVLPAVYEESEE